MASFALIGPPAMPPGFPPATFAAVNLSPVPATMPISFISDLGAAPADSEPGGCTNGNSVQ